MLPQELCLRLASWAVTVAVPVGETPPLLASGQLPGLVQTAFRAEIAAALSAMLFAVRAGCALVLYFDCQGVVDRVLGFLAGLPCPGPSSQNSDFWKRVFAAVRCRSEK